MSNHNIRVDAIGLAAEVVELRNEIARLKNQTNWVCQCGGTDCKGQRENAELNATLDAIIAADERAVQLWRAAHPGNELVIPDRGKLVGWLLDQNAELRAHAERVGQANDRLAVENDVLRADKERLDWLTDTGCLITFPSLSKRPNWEQGTARDVIDAARKEAQL